MAKSIALDFGEGGFEEEGEIATQPMIRIFDMIMSEL